MKTVLSLALAVSLLAQKPRFDVEGVIEKLGAELHTQYVLSFTPDSPTLGCHHLEMRVAGKRDLLVRAQPGYWAAGGAI